MPRISVIVPAYNAEALISACIDSVLAQLFADWELIVVNDGSRDKTAALCDAYAEKDSRVRVIHQENGGVSAARNRGLSEASGELIAFLDADDTLVPVAFSVMVDCMDKTNANTAACACFLTYPDGSPPLCEPLPFPPGYYDSDAARLNISLPLLADRLSPHPLNGYVWRFLLSRRIIEENSIRFSGKYLEDELFLIEYFCCGASLAVTDNPLYLYFQNAGSVTKKYLPGFTDTFFASLDKKEALVRDYAIPVPAHWRDNTCWAGLLIAVSNEFAPGNSLGLLEKAKRIREICVIPACAQALSSYQPKEIQGNKALVARLLRSRLYLPLACIYSLKNKIRR